MKPAGPSFRPRVSGGFNQGMGDFNEHLDENAMQQTVQQKALGQQQADPGQSPVVGQKQQQSPFSQGQAPSPDKPAPQKPRPVSPRQELKWFGRDVFKGLQSLLSLESALGIDPATDSPEDQAKKKQFHQRYNKLSQEEQEYAKQLYRQKMQQKKQEEEQAERKKQEAAKQEQQEVVVPSSPQKGPIGPGMSRKQKATAQLAHNRKVLGAPSGSN